MIQDNASFTFLHRIEEVELNIEDGRWQSALALALTLPDICGGIAFPDIEQFCRRMCQAVRAYYEAVDTEKDFNLYNTPVLDFIKASQDEQSNATVAIMCSDPAYGNGLRLVLQKLSNLCDLITEMLF